MAHTVNVQTLLDSSRQLIVNVTIVGDGASGELSAQKVIDVSTFNPAFTESSILEIKSSLDSFGVLLLWDATTDDEAYALGAGEADLDFRPIGGLVNPSSTGATGDLMITTNGLNASSKAGSIQLTLRKRELGS